MDCQAGGSKCKETQKNKKQQENKSESRMSCRRMLRMYRSYSWNSDSMLLKLRGKMLGSAAAIATTLYFVSFQADASRASLTLGRPEATFTHQKSRQQLIERYDILTKELEQAIQQLKGNYNRCKTKGICLKAEICPASLGSLDSIREMRDVVHDLYYLHGRGYLSWVKNAESDVEKTEKSHYIDLGCRD